MGSPVVVADENNDGIQHAPQRSDADSDWDILNFV
jgi:hypothetical protein